MRLWVFSLGDSRRTFGIFRTSSSSLNLWSRCNRFGLLKDFLSLNHFRGCFPLSNSSRILTLFLDLSYTHLLVALALSDLPLHSLISLERLLHLFLPLDILLVVFIPLFILLIIHKPIREGSLAKTTRRAFKRLHFDFLFLTLNGGGLGLDLRRSPSLSGLCFNFRWVGSKLGNINDNLVKFNWLLTV